MKTADEIVAPDPAQRISVCMPYWYQQAELDRMLVNYGALYHNIPLEFSICDDGTPIPAVARSVCPNHTVVLTRLPTKQKALNPCVPINRAVTASSGEVIVLTSPEIRHPAVLLPEMIAGLTDPLSYVIAPCLDRQRGWLAGPSVNYGVGGRWPVPPGGHFHFCVAFSRTLWKLAGGFDEDYRDGQACDDNDWLWRLAAVGAQFHTLPHAVSHESSGRLVWDLAHNGPLFDRKWPPARRAAITAANMDLATGP